jgi:hypothetical protein
MVSSRISRMGESRKDEVRVPGGISPGKPSLFGNLMRESMTGCRMDKKTHGCLPDGRVIREVKAALA